MKQLIPYLLGLALVLPFMANAQTKEQAKTEFLAELNDIIKNSPQQHWAFEGQEMTIEEPYSIDENGVLSVTISYRDGIAFMITKTEGPVRKISRVLYDVYLILEFEDDDVSSYYSDDGSAELIPNEKMDLFHLGAPQPEDVQRQVRLQGLLDRLLVYYED